jgi:hypothetical protein
MNPGLMVVDTAPPNFQNERPGGVPHFAVVIDRHRHGFPDDNGFSLSTSPFGDISTMSENDPNKSMASATVPRAVVGCWQQSGTVGPRRERLNETDRDHRGLVPRHDTRRRHRPHQTCRAGETRRILSLPCIPAPMAIAHKGHLEGSWSLRQP